MNPQIQTPEFGPVNFAIVEEEADFDDGHAWLETVLSSPNRDELELELQAAAALDRSNAEQPTQGPTLGLAIALAAVALLTGLGFLLF